MFSSNKDRGKSDAISGASNERNVIAKNTSIVGDIVSDGDFRVDGTLKGNLKTKGRVIIGSEGVVEGEIEATNADIEGKFSGDLTVSELLTVKSSADIFGEIVIGKLSVESGAAFNANFSMKGAVKELNKKSNNTKSEQTA